MGWKFFACSTVVARMRIDMVLLASALLAACTVPPHAAVVRDDFAWIPTATSVIGDELGVGQEDERPARLVHVPGFWLATKETTNAQFAAFLNATAAPQSDWCDFASHKFLLRQNQAGSWESSAPTLPVVTVSWSGAMAYCAWLSESTGRRCRLPSEVEWERAARGPQGHVYAYGSTYRAAAANQESGRLMPVASFLPNAHGLYDMTGNAFEWTADWYHRDRYAMDAAPLLGDCRVLRGGSFVLDGIFLRNSMRMKLRPQVRADDVGFRVAMNDEVLR